MAFSVLVPHEPDEAGAEHGVGGRDEGGAERFGGGEGVADLGGDGVGHFGRSRGEGGEEVVVGPGHAGVVEEGGRVGLAGVRDDEVFGEGVGEWSVWISTLARGQRVR